MKKNIFLGLVILLLLSATTTLANRSVVADTAKIATETIPARFIGLSPRKPLTAFLLSSLQPGAGQFYNRQNTKGAIILALDFSAGVALITSFRTPNYSFGPSGVQVVSFIIIFGTEIYQLIDAPIAAVTVNNRYHLGAKKNAFNGIKLSPTLINSNMSPVKNKPVFGLSLTLR